jgi:hypothetical protein
MRKWIVNEPGGERGEINEIRTVTDEEILSEYWDFWKDEMEKKYGADSQLITEESCIKDWVVTNWAWEWKDDLDC